MVCLGGGGGQFMTRVDLWPNIYGTVYLESIEKLTEMHVPLTDCQERLMARLDLWPSIKRYTFSRVYRVSNKDDCAVDFLWG